MIAKKLMILFLLCLFLMAGSNLKAELPINYGFQGLLHNIQHPEELKNLDCLTKQIDSHDTSGGNIDYGNFYFECQEDDDECVLAEIEGPGEILRLFFAFYFPTDLEKHLRIYIDGEKIPTVDCSLADFFKGQYFPQAKKLVTHDEISGGGFVSYLPIAFSQSIKITIERPSFRVPGWLIDIIHWWMTGDGWFFKYDDKYAVYYQVTYREFSKDTEIKSFSLDLDWPEEMALAQIVDILKNIGQDPKKGDEKDLEWIKEKCSIKPKTTKVLADIEVEDFGSISRVIMKIDKNSDKHEILKDVFLKIYWDQEEKPSIRVPLRAFFGSYYDTDDYKTLFLGKYYNFFPMPFKKTAIIEIVNNSQKEISIEFKTAYREIQKQNSLARLKVVWRKGKTAIGQDYTVLNHQGQGHYVATLFNVSHYDSNPMPNPFPLSPDAEPFFVFLEGDPKIKVDNEQGFSIHGTGFEEQLDGAWYFDKVFGQIFSALTCRYRDKETTRISGFYLSISNYIPFTESIEIYQEFGPTNNGQGDDVSSASFFYQY